MLEDRYGKWDYACKRLREGATDEEIVNELKEKHPEIDYKTTHYQVAFIRKKEYHLKDLGKEGLK